MKKFRLRGILLALAGVIASGTVFFRMVEGWNWVDSYFFVVVTLSTVGYGDPVPQTELGRIGTTVFIFTGIGIFAYAINSFVEFMSTHRLRNIHHHHHHHDGSSE